MPGSHGFARIASPDSIGKRAAIAVRLAFVAWSVALAAAAAPAMAAAADLDRALASAKGGERIELAGGVYETLELRKRRFSSDVTIAPADPSKPVIVHSMTIDGSEHLVLDGIRFDYVAGPDASTKDNPFQVAHSSHITIRNSVFDGDEIHEKGREGTYGTGKALTVRGSDNVVIERNEFYKFWKALNIFESSNVVVRRNDIHTLRSDGMNFSSIDGLLVEGNHLHDFKLLPRGGDHRDMIQWWALKPSQYFRNVTITGNFLDAGGGAMTQSIFSRNVPAEKGGGASVFFRNVKITDNVIYNGHVNGLVVGATDGLVIRNNTVLFDEAAVFGPGERGRGAPQVRLQSNSLNVEVSNNILEKSVDRQQGWTVRNNMVADSAAYGRLFRRAHAAHPTLDDLRAAPGGPIQKGGFGARMTRENIEIDAGPAGR